jgi:iron complex outermembrane receptor protein
MAGLIFQPDEHWSIYASYASSFSAPSPGAVDINNNPINTPEKASQIESGVKASLMRHRLDVTLSVFDIKKKNVIESLGSGFSRLAGGERSTGGEIEVDATPLPNWKIIAGYSYIKARVSEDIDPTLIGVRLSNAPVHTASLFTSYDFDAGALSGVGLSFGVNYASMRYGTQPTTGSRLVLPGYTVVDAGIHYNAERYSVTLQAKNLFDKRYYESASNNLRISPGAPRSVSLTLKVRL